MFNKLGANIGAGLLAAALALGGSAQALTLDCKNLTQEPIAVSVSYLGADGKTWFIEGWYNLEGQKQALIELPSSNDIFYIFGEFGNGVKVEGGSGSVQMPVVWDDFQYTQSQPLQKPDSVEQFVRGVATKGYAQISFGPFNN